MKRFMRSLPVEELDSSVSQASGGNRVNRILEKISLRDVSLDDRRKEALKPLFLTRYE